MEPLFEHRMQFAGVETRVLELEGRGDPFVLFHGWSDSADTWRHVLALLARHERRAIAVDLPGFGAADAASEGPLLPQLDAFGAEALAYATADIRPARGRVSGSDSGTGSRRARGAAVRAGASVPGRARGGRARGRRAIVVGNSLGGCLALRLAERGVVGGVSVERVVALAPAGLDMAGWFRLVEHDPVLRTLLALPVPLPGRAVQEVVGRVYGALAFAHPDGIEPGVMRAFTRHHPDRAAVARLLASGRRLLPELRDCYELSSISCPVQLIWGDRDRMVYARGAERVLAEVADARLELLEDCGHCPQVERPERVVELLLADERRSAVAA
jgi:pimeloyl-ACP methyl ester carboxylesterase